MSVFDVPAGALIKAIATDLKKQGIEQPAWTSFVKTGTHKERAPDSPDWFYERMASILYRIFKDGPVGTGSLRSYYGGKKRRGVKKSHFRKASGKVIRVCLQLLEKQGLIKKDKKGRVITGKGQSYLNTKAKEATVIAKQMVKEKQKPKEEKHAEKTAEEKKVAEELKKQEQAVKDKEKAKEEAKKKDKKKEEKKQEEA